MRELQLSSIHKSLDADMGSFAGWEAPIKYDRIMAEHLAVRKKAGIFDTSHMGEILVSGKNALKLLQLVLSREVSDLEVNSAKYSTILNKNGGIKDDLFVYRIENSKYLLVTNAGNTEKILEWLREHKDEDVQVENITSSTVMLAIQGPKAQKILQKTTKTNLKDIDSFEATHIEIAGVPVLVSRSGYTGEDGFEVFIFDQTPKNTKEAEKLWNEILKIGKKWDMKPCGLGARDSLRLEAGYPLYGNELSEEITPLEAKIEHAVSFDKENFIGKEALLQQKNEGISKKRVGITMKDKGIPRKQNPVLKNNKKIGKITSGGYSPTQKTGIAMAYTPPNLQPNDKINIKIRKKTKNAIITKWPFYEVKENG